MTNIKSNVADCSDELLDADLKQILGKRYQDASHLFTPEAQECRRNNRLVFTVKITAFIITVINFLLWAHLQGLLSFGKVAFGLIGCAVVIGYNAGVCVSHMKGWRD